MPQPSTAVFRQSSGKVVRIFPDGGYGFFVSSVGQDIYSHRTGVLRRSFGKPGTGDAVCIVVVEGESAEGSEASAVDPLGKRQLAEWAP